MDDYNELYDELYDELYVDDFSEKNREKRKARRKTDVRKATRKKKIAEHVLGYKLYDNLHQYSKNKVHCSCNLCRFRSVYNPDAKTMSDYRKIDACDCKYAEYVTGEAM